MIKANTIVIIIISIVLMYMLLKKDEIEPYYDVLPYKYHWNIFKCLTPECIKKEGYKCYKECDTIPELGAGENCRMRCMDYSDQQFDQIKFQDYRFHGLLPSFYNYTLLNGSDYF